MSPSSDSESVNGIVWSGVRLSEVIVAGRQKRERSDRKEWNASCSSGVTVVLLA